MDFPGPDDGGSVDVAAAVGIDPESPDRVMRASVGDRRAPAQEKVAERTGKYSDLATAAVGAKTPALEVVDLFAAIERTVSVKTLDRCDAKAHREAPGVGE